MNSANYCSLNTAIIIREMIHPFESPKPNASPLIELRTLVLEGIAGGGGVGSLRHNGIGGCHVLLPSHMTVSLP